MLSAVLGDLCVFSRTKLLALGLFGDLYISSAGYLNHVYDMIYIQTKPAKMVKHA